MSENLEIERDDDSDLVKQLRKQLRDSSTKVKAAEDAASAATRSLGERQLADVLTAKKLSPKLARFIAKDDVDPSDTDAVETWLKENSDTFGFTLADPPEQQANASEADIEAFRQMQQAGLGQPVQRSTVESILAKLGDDASPEQVAAAFHNSGV